MARKSAIFIIFLFLALNKLFCATYTVTNNSDLTIAGSLRGALVQAMGNPGHDTIVFANDFTISLTGNNRVFTLDPAGVTIDAQDKTIIIDGSNQTSSNTWPGVGIWLVDTGLLWGGGQLGANTTVKGLIFRNFTHVGVLVSGGSYNNNIIDCTFYDVNTSALKIDGTDKDSSGQYVVQNNTIENCVSYNNGALGIEIVNSNNNSIKNSICYGNAASGIAITNSNNIDIVNPTCYNNTANGILLTTVDDCLIQNANLYNNSTNGMHIITSQNVKITRNSIYDNTNNGILVVDSSNNSIGDSKILGNGNAGIWLINNTNNNKIYRNRIGINQHDENRGNTWSGVLISGGASGNYIGGNDPALGNIIAYNTGEGVKIDEKVSKHNLVRFNTYFENKAGGFVVYSGANEGLPPPYLYPPHSLETANNVSLYGLATPGTTVDIYISDSQYDKTQGRYYKGSVIADSLGEFIYDFYYDMPGKLITAVVHDTRRNSSGFALTYNGIGLNGKVIDSKTGKPVFEAEVLLYDKNSRLYAGATTDSEGNFTFPVTDGIYAIKIRKQGYSFPSKIKEDLSSPEKGEFFRIRNNLSLTIPIDSGYPINVSILTSSDKITQGEPLKLKVKLNNYSLENFSNAILDLRLPKSFKIINSTFNISSNSMNENASLSKNDSLNITKNLNNITTIDAKTLEAGGNILIPLADVSGKSELTLSGVFTVSGGANESFINLSARVYRKQGPQNEYLSSLKTKTVEITKDEFLDNSTLIGKVFFDKNQNGIQDEKEIGIPHVTLITEQGIIITTDKNGQYSIPSLQKGSHQISIKSDSLPDGCTYEKSKLIYIREGSLHKVNFPIYSSKNLSFEATNTDIIIEENLTTIKPYVEVVVEKSGSDLYLKKNSDNDYNLNFNVITNCKLSIKKLIFILKQEKSGEIIFEEEYEMPLIPSKITVPISLSMLSKLNNKAISAYLKVQFNNNNEIETIPSIIKISKEGMDEDLSIFSERKFSSNVNFSNHEISLPVEASVKASGYLLSNNDYIIMCKQNDVLLFTDSIYTNEDGSFSYDCLIPFGKYEISIAKDNTENIVTSKIIDLKESRFIFSAIAEAEIGKLNSSGNIEMTGKADDFDDTLYSESKAAFYLKGKIKGKYLITMSYDSKRDDTSLFKYLDPDKYYPIYGDNSQISYDGEDSKEKFYLLVEWNQNSLKWGNFKANFTENSLINYTRALYGVKVELKSEEIIETGRRKYEVIFFGSSPDAVRDILRFPATGGSVYYLKESDIIPGSETIFLEVRDSITNMTLQTIPQVRDIDYGIDYDSGRIIFTSPPPQTASSNHLTDQNISFGNPLYVVVNYEYEPDSLIHKNTLGLRVEKSIFDKVSVGATIIGEENPSGDTAELKSADIIVKINKNTSLKLEAAQTEKETVKSISSNNGGLSFNNNSTNIQNPKGDAYSAEIVSGKENVYSSRFYYEKRENGFYNPNDINELGREKYGAEVKINPKENVTIYSEIFHEKMDEDFSNEDYEKRAEDTIGLSWKILDKLNLETEYKYINQEFGANINDEKLELIGLGAFFDLSSRIHLFLKHQYTIDGIDSDASTIGARYKLFEKFSIGLSTTNGDRGDYSRAHLSFSPSENREIYLSAGQGYSDEFVDNSSELTLGMNELIDKYTSMYTEYKYYNTDNSNYTSTVTGYRKKLNDYTNINLSFENNDTDSNGGKSLTAFSGISYSKPDKTYIGGAFEFHESENTSEIEQILTTAKIKHYFDNGISLFLRTEHSITKDDVTNFNEAYFKEFSTGAAFRPRNFDRIHFLGKYTYLKENPPSSKDDDMNIFERQDKILSGEAIIDIFKGFQYFVKYAVRKSLFEESEIIKDEISSRVDLWIHRFNLYFTEKYGTAFEYRKKEFKSLDEEKEGYLAEIFFDPINNLRLTLGYNFTDFSDSLIPANDYDYGGPYFRITGKAFFDELKFNSPFKTEYYTWKPFEYIPDSIILMNKMDISIGFYEGEFEWNLSNVSKWEYDWRYLFGEDKENTFDPAFYNRIETYLEIPFNDNISQKLIIGVDPSVITAKKTVTATSGWGDSAKITYLYSPFENKIIPLSIRTENGGAFLTGEQKVKDLKVNSYEVKTGWGDTFTIPGFEFEDDIMPFKEISTKFKSDNSYLKLNWLSDQNTAPTLDDPLVLSGNKNFWQPHPWTYEWKPGTFYYGNMQAFERGKIDDSLTYYNKNSFAEFMTKLRGIQFGSEIDDIGRFEANIASPIFQWDFYDEYFNPNNVNGAFRYKSSMLNETHEIQIGATYAFRVGYNNDKLDFSNQVFGGDVYFKTIFDIMTTLEYASSETETDKTSNFRQDLKGNSYKVILQKIFDEGLSKNEITLLYTVMDDTFFAGGSDYRFTSLDQFWSRHITFHKYDENFTKNVLAFREGDGIRENRKVAQFKIKSSKEDLILNYFSIMNVVTANDNEFLENRFRDELSLFLHPKFTMKLMLLHYEYPDTEEGIEPLFGKTSVAKDLIPGGQEKTILNDAILEGEDPSISTYSLGFKWSLTDWFDLISVYEYTNNFGDQFPQFIIQDTSYGNVETINGIRYDSPVTYLYGQSIFEQPAYDFYSIYRIKTIFHLIEEKLDFIASYAKNENKFAGGIDDNINHIFLGFEYISSDKKIKYRINHTRSKSYDIADYVNTGVLNYESHDNFFTEIRYELTKNSTIYAHYGIFGGMQENPVSPFVVVPWNLPVLDTRNIFKIAYSKKF